MSSSVSLLIAARMAPRPLFPPRINEDIHDPPANGGAIRRDVVEEIDLNQPRLARPNHFDRFPLDIGLAATSTDRPEDLSPCGHDHLCPDFSGSRPASRDNRSHRNGFSLVKKLFDLMIDRLLLLFFCVGAFKTCSLACHTLSSST